MFLFPQGGKRLAAVCLLTLLIPGLNASAQTGSPVSGKPAVPATGKAAPAPKISIAQPEFNFGEVKEGTDLSHTFILRNEGTAPLEVKSVAPS